MAEKRSVSVRLRGQEFRVLSEDDEGSLQRVARHVDETMSQVEERTGTVDTLDLALLTALNLARDLDRERQRRGDRDLDPERLRALIELAESALPQEAS